MDVKNDIKRIFGTKKGEENRYKNTSSQSLVQVKRLDNYSDEILEVLEEYANEIESSMIPYNRKLGETTMMASGTRKSSQKTTNRKTHIENVTGIAVEIAKKRNLCVGATRIIAENHDRGHTPLGHAGERWLSKIKEDLGLGFYVHNALGPQELIYREHIYDIILNNIKEYNPQITERELKRIRKSLWLIFDGINSHNGERTETEFTPDKSKTETVFMKELENCFVIKGYDKKIVPATIEGCLIRLCDKISYIPYDMVDGIEEGFIDEIDGEYIPVLKALGISEKEIEQCNTRKKYDSIVRKLQITFTKDVIKNSTSTSIRMSEEISKYMHELRNINNRRIVKYTVLKDDNEIYPTAMKTLIKKCAQIVINNGIMEELEYGEINSDKADRVLTVYEGTPFEDFARYMINVTHDEFEFMQNVIYQSMVNTITNEQEVARQIVLGKKEFVREAGYENRDARIQRYVEYYNSIGISENYSQHSIQEDVGKELGRQEIEGEDQSFDHKIALEIGARYISQLNDIELFKLIKNTGLINEEQAKSLTRTYKEIGQEGLRKEVDMQKGLVELIKEQHEDSKKIGYCTQEHEDR